MWLGRLRNTGTTSCRAVGLQDGCRVAVGLHVDCTTVIPGKLNHKMQRIRIVIAVAVEDDAMEAGAQVGPLTSLAAAQPEHATGGSPVNRCSHVTLGIGGPAAPAF
ncbi:hypothetical protein J1614_004642 [Plenodomus biglobosus]|nr:hypothetical protein J1614_004642 [Plenodomus biglobosus]